jgi:hypothetical protein
MDKSAEERLVYKKLKSADADSDTEGDSRVVKILERLEMAWLRI